MKQFLSILKKKRNILCVLLFLFMALLLSECLLSCQTTDFDTTFQAFTEELFRQELSSNTISLHYTLENPDSYGIDNFPASYGELSCDPDSTLSTLETYLTSLEAFSSVPLSEKNRLTYNILHSYLTVSKEGAKYLLYQEPLGLVSGIHTQLPILLSEYQFHNTSDVETYLDLLAQTSNYFDSILKFEKEKINAGTFMPDSQIDSIVSYCNSFTEMENSNYLYSSFEERLEQLDLSDREKDAFSARNQTLIQEYVFPAYQNLANSLSKLKGNGTNEMGLFYLPSGKEYYEYLIKQEVGVSEDIDTLQEMTMTQIKADLLAMENVLLEYDSSSGNDMPTASLQTNSNFLGGENSILSAPPSAMLDDLRAKMNSSFPQIPPVATEIKYVSSEMEEFLSPAFYMIPTIDNTSENVIYINNGQTVAGLNLYTTLAHEGYPGHLYQTVYFASKNPDPIRSILDYGGYVEGWATFAEMMSYYFAPLSKSDATLLQKNTSAILGLYAFADMGIHYDGWTLQDMIHFFSEYGISDVEILQEIYELILSSPSNYVTYYIGYLKIYNLKKEVSEKMGRDFSQLAFHKAILDVGPAPFDIVEEYVRKELYETN